MTFQICHLFGKEGILIDSHASSLSGKFMSTTTPLIALGLESQPVVAPTNVPLRVAESEQSIVVHCEPLRSRIVTAKIIGRSRGEPNVILSETEQ
jgi:hypothetical protein